MRDDHVTPGQTWEDMDRRAKGRRLEVERLFMGTDHLQYAACRVVGTGKLTNIRVSRFSPGSTGYRLLSDPRVPAPKSPARHPAFIAETEKRLTRAQDQLAEALRAVRSGQPASCLVFVTEAASELSGVQQALHTRV